MANGAEAHRECSPLALALALATITCSACLIAFNKYLINKDRFPFAVPLVLLHMAVSFGLSACLRVVQPGLFPSLTDPGSSVLLDRRLIMRGLLPVGLFFVGQLVLSNTAYLYASVAFLQMMKESNLVLVYLLSLAAALERFRCRNLCLLLLIIAATSMTIRGEVHFSPAGFGLQGTSQLLESMKIVLQGVLLSSGGVRLDAFSYVLLVSPGCLFFLLCLAAALWAHPLGDMRVPSLQEVRPWWPLLLANALVAYLLNVVSALFLKHSSPVAYILAGIMKDFSIVMVGVLLLQEDISTLQATGFAFQLLFIFLWTLMKSFPAHFEAGMLAGLRAVVFGRPAQVPDAKGGCAKAERSYGSLEEGPRALARGGAPPPHSQRAA